MKVLVTTAIVYPSHRRYGNLELIKKREQEYFSFFQRMKEMNLDVYVVECIHEGPTSFLNSIIPDDRLFYSKMHNPSLRNQGVDEINSLKKAIDFFSFDENEILVKITGRYMPKTSYFFDEIKKCEEKFDAFYYVFPDNHSGKNQMFTGMFAINVKILSDYFNEVNLIEMENYMINFEASLKKFLDKKRGKLFSKLDIKVLPGGGETPWEI